MGNQVKSGNRKKRERAFVSAFAYKYVHTKSDNNDKQGKQSLSILQPSGYKLSDEGKWKQTKTIKIL